MIYQICSIVCAAMLLGLPASARAELWTCVDTKTKRTVYTDTPVSSAHTSCRTTTFATGTYLTVSNEIFANWQPSVDAVGPSELRKSEAPPASHQERGRLDGKPWEGVRVPWVVETQKNR